MRAFSVPMTPDMFILTLKSGFRLFPRWRSWHTKKPASRSRRWPDPVNQESARARSRSLVIFSSALRTVSVGEDLQRLHLAPHRPRRARYSGSAGSDGPAPDSLRWPQSPQSRASAMARGPRRVPTSGRIRRRGVDLILNVHSLFLVNERIIEAARIVRTTCIPVSYPNTPGPELRELGSISRRDGYGAHAAPDDPQGRHLRYRLPGPLSGRNRRHASFPHPECVRAGAPLISRLLDDAAVGPDAIPRIPQALDPPCGVLGKDAPHSGRLSVLGARRPKPPHS